MVIALDSLAVTAELKYRRFENGVCISAARRGGRGLERSISRSASRSRHEAAEAKGQHIGRPQAAIDEQEMRDMLAARHSMAEVGSALREDRGGHIDR